MVSFTPQPLLYQGKNSGTHWLGAWVGPRAGLDVVAKRKILLKSLNTASHVIVYSVFKYSAVSCRSIFTFWSSKICQLYWSSSWCQDLSLWNLFSGLWLVSSLMINFKKVLVFEISFIQSVAMFFVGSPWTDQDCVQGWRFWSNSRGWLWTCMWCTSQLWTHMSGNMSSQG
jgi:hypothetical protein